MPRFGTSRNAEPRCLPLSGDPPRLTVGITFQINRRRLDADADADADAVPAAIGATGCHEYFTTTQAVGAAGTLQQHLAELAALPRT